MLGKEKNKAPFKRDERGCALLRAFHSISVGN